METNKYEFIMEYIYNNEELEKVFIFKLAVNERISQEDVNEQRILCYEADYVMKL